MNQFNKVVRKEITVGVLLGGLGIALFFWFTAYSQEEALTFSSFTISEEYYSY